MCVFSSADLLCSVSIGNLRHKLHSPTCSYCHHKIVCGGTKCPALSHLTQGQQCFSMIPLQPIRIQTTSGKVETAILHTFEMQTPGPAPEAAEAHATASVASRMTSSDMRVCALHQRSPIQMYMFNSHGVLLNANKAALQGLESPAGMLSTSCSEMGFFAPPACRAQARPTLWYALAYIPFTKVAKMLHE